MASKLSISVITPSFNQGSFLEETIQSVAAQNYPLLEHLVIDGGSSDQSVQILQKYNVQLTYWVSEPDRGQSHAINKGLQRATGQIVMWLNSDDVLLPGALARISEIFSAQPGVDFIHGKSVLFGDVSKELTLGEGLSEMESRYLATIPFPQPSSFFRKSLSDMLGPLNEELDYGMDYEYLVRAVLTGTKPFAVNEFFSKYRLHANSKTKDKIQFSIEWSGVFSKMLRSVGNADDLIQQMQAAGVYHEGDDRFPVTFFPDKITLQQALLFHLQTQANYYYSALDFNKTRPILQTIRRISPDFYRSQKLQTLNFKSRYLPKPLITLLRNLTRL